MENDAYARYLNGDDKALLEIIQKYKNSLTMYINSMVKNLEISDELCCETFVILADKKPKFRGSSSFGTFLFGIGRHTALSYLRKNSRRNEIPLDDIGEIPDDRDPEKEYLKKEQNLIFYNALKKLKRDYAEAVWLMYFEELSCEEIGKVMNKSTSAVKVLLHRARIALKNELLKEGYNYEIG